MEVAAGGDKKAPRRSQAKVMKQQIRTAIYFYLQNQLCQFLGHIFLLARMRAILLIILCE